MTAITLARHVADAQPVRHYNFAEFCAEYAPYTEQAIARLFDWPSDDDYVKSEALKALRKAFSDASKQICMHGSNPDDNCHSRIPLTMTLVGGIVLSIATATIYPVTQLGNPMLNLIPAVCILGAGASFAGGMTELITARIDDSKIQKQIHNCDENDPSFKYAFGSQDVYKEAEQNITNYISGIKASAPAP